MNSLSGTGVFRSNKKMIIIVVAVMFSFPAFACEICGCSINGYHYGILPQFKKNIFGVRYQYRSFQSQHLISEQLYILGNKSTEYYNSVELWGRFYAGKNVQLFAFMPYNHYLTNEKGNKTTAKGIGDITIAANYTLFSTAAAMNKNFKQTLLAGGGIKLPTGKFNTAKSGQELNPSINSGTGSVDYLANIIYNCRYKYIGLNLDANYRINSTNKDDFKYGNRFTTAAKLFYWQNIGIKTTLLPNAGLLFENAAKDKHGEEAQNFSGGNITFFSAGLEVYRGKINVGATYNHPLNQNMFKGLVKNNNQFSVNVSLML